MTHPERPARGLAVISVSALSTQSGAATGSLAFGTLGPLGVVAARQIVAALVLLVLTRPRVHRLTREQWPPIVLLAVLFASMNSSLYAAVERVGLGTAVTIEFLGPLAVALLSSRRWRDAVCATLALAGIVLLTRPGPSSDLIGLGLAVLAGASWAGYIMANRAVGRLVPGVQGTAVAMTLSAVGLLPVAAIIIWQERPPVEAYLFAAAAGLFASAVPYTLDLIVLRRISPVVFGLGMSLHPVFAALIGAVALHQHLPALAWTGIGLVAVSNALTLIGARPPRHVQRRRIALPPRRRRHRRSAGANHPGTG